MNWEFDTISAPASSLIDTSMYVQQQLITNPKYLPKHPMLLKMVRCWGSTSSGDMKEIMGVFYADDEFNTATTFPYFGTSAFQWTQDVFTGQDAALDMLNGLSWQQQVPARVSMTTTAYDIGDATGAQFVIFWPKVPG